MKNIISAIVLAACLAPAVFSQKVDVKDVISKHIASIVSAEQKTKITNLTDVGEASYVQGTNYQRSYPGKSVIVSDGKKFALALEFSLQEYPMERVIFDGKKVSLSYIQPGVRSALGNYLYTYDEIVKEGLFGGVLSTGWLFNFPDEKKGSMSYSGLKKLDGKEVHVISYNTRGGTGLSVKLFFEAATGRHLRSEYRRTSTSSTVSGNPDASASLTRDIIEEMSEEFGDFKTEAGVTLPTTYKIRISQSNGGRSAEWTYTIKVSTFYYNQQLDASTFVPQAN